MLMQGEDDTLFNLNEAVSTYHELRAQHTPVKMVWQSWGHSSLAAANGELGSDLGIVDAAGHVSVEGQMVLDWFDHYLKKSGPTPALEFQLLSTVGHVPGRRSRQGLCKRTALPDRPGPGFCSGRR